MFQGEIHGRYDEISLNTGQVDVFCLISEWDVHLIFRTLCFMVLLGVSSDRYWESMSKLGNWVIRLVKVSVGMNSSID